MEIGSDCSRTPPLSCRPPCGCCSKPNSDGQQSDSVVGLMEIELDDCISDKIVSIAAPPPPQFPLPVFVRSCDVEISQYTCHRIGTAPSLSVTMQMKLFLPLPFYCPGSRRRTRLRSSSCPDQKHPLELSLVVAQCGGEGKATEDDYNSREAWRVDRVTWPRLRPPACKLARPTDSLDCRAMKT